MSIEQVISERRTVHSYTNEEVPRELINKAFEMAIMAPNHKLTFPFLFILVGKETRNKVADIAFELKGQKEPIRTKFQSEGSLVFFAQKLADDEFTRKEDYATMACAIQNYSLYLWEQGYGSKWSSGQIIRSDETYKVLNINPDEYEIVGMIWAGKFKSEPRVPERPQLTDVIQETD